jgi:hypothetical protein
MKFQFGKRKNKELAMMMASRRANSIATVKRRKAFLKRM